MRLLLASCLLLSSFPASAQMVVGRAASAAPAAGVRVVPVAPVIPSGVNNGVSHRGLTILPSLTLPSPSLPTPMTQAAPAAVLPSAVPAPVSALAPVAAAAPAAPVPAAAAVAETLEESARGEAAPGQGAALWSATFDGAAPKRGSEDDRGIAQGSAASEVLVAAAVPAAPSAPRRALLAPAALALPASLEFAAPALPYLGGAGILGGTWLAVRGVNRLIGALARWRGWDPSTAVVARLGSEVLLWAAGGSMALRVMGLDWGTVFASLGIGGLAVTLATKEFLGNFIRGLVLMADSPMRIGDRLRIDGKDYKVTDMTFRYVVLQELEGQFVLMSYSSLSGQAFAVLERAPDLEPDASAPGLSSLLRPARRFGPWFWAGAAALAAGGAWLALSVPATLPYVSGAGILAGVAVLERLAVRGLGALAKRRGWSPTGAAVARLGTTLALWVAGLLAGLSTAGVPWNLLIGGATVLGVAVSVAAADILSNLIQAVWLLVARPFRVGDRIAVGKADGRVKDMTLRYVVLESELEGRPVPVYVPYSVVAAGPLRIFRDSWGRKL